MSDCRRNMITIDFTLNTEYAMYIMAIPDVDLTHHRKHAIFKGKTFLDYLWVYTRNPRKPGKLIPVCSSQWKMWNFEKIYSNQGQSGNFLWIQIVAHLRE